MIFLSEAEKNDIATCVRTVTVLPKELAALVLDYYLATEEIFSTSAAFAAKLANGQIVAWGDASRGGDCSSVQAELKDVDTIYSTDSAFAAKLVDGSVVTWGDATYGGKSDAAREQLAADVQHIYSTGGAFAAVRSDGSAVTWGDAEGGGDCDAVQ